MVLVGAARVAMLSGGTAPVAGDAATVAYLLTWQADRCCRFPYVGGRRGLVARADSALATDSARLGFHWP